MNIQPTLCTLVPGQGAVVDGISATGRERRRLRELGFTDGAHTELLLSRGGMNAYLIKGTVIALRQSDSDAILIDHIMRGADEHGGN